MERALKNSPIVLVHGLWHSPRWLLLLDKRLRAAGCSKIERFGYPSILQAPEVAVARLEEKLRHAPPTVLIGHSLGGLIALETLARHPDLPVRSILCLGTPLRGSRVAQYLAGRRSTAWLLGRSRELLCRGCTGLPPSTPVCMLAGARASGVGCVLMRLPHPSDGTVLLEETRLDGLESHTTLDVTHSGLLFSKPVVEEIFRALKPSINQH